MGIGKLLLGKQRATTLETSVAVLLQARDRCCLFRATNLANFFGSRPTPGSVAIFSPHVLSMKEVSRSATARLACQCSLLCGIQSSKLRWEHDRARKHGTRTRPTAASESERPESDLSSARVVCTAGGDGALRRWLHHIDSFLAALPSYQQWGRVVQSDPSRVQWARQ